MILGTVDVYEFESLIGSCTGQVSLVTAQGDLLVARGLLTSRIGFRHFLDVARRLDVKIICDNPLDQQRVTRFMARHQASIPLQEHRSMTSRDI